MSAIDTIRRSGTAKPKSPMASVLSWVGMQLERRRSRLALLEMSDEQLKDIGISRADAYHEAYRPFWE